MSRIRKIASNSQKEEVAMDLRGNACYQKKLVAVDSSTESYDPNSLVGQLRARLNDIFSKVRDASTNSHLSENPSGFVITDRRTFMKIAAGGVASVATGGTDPLLATLTKGLPETVAVPASVIPDLLIPYFSRERADFLGGVSSKLNHLKMMLGYEAPRIILNEQLVGLANVFAHFAEEDSGKTILPPLEELVTLERFLAEATRETGSTLHERIMAKLYESTEEIRPSGMDKLAKDPVVSASIEKEYPSYAGLEDHTFRLGKSFLDHLHRTIRDLIRISRQASKIEELLVESGSHVGANLFGRLMQEGGEILRSHRWYHAQRKANSLRDRIEDLERKAGHYRTWGDTESSPEQMPKPSPEEEATYQKEVEQLYARRRKAEKEAKAEEEAYETYCEQVALGAHVAIMFSTFQFGAPLPPVKNETHLLG